MGCLQSVSLGEYGFSCRYDFGSHPVVGWLRNNNFSHISLAYFISALLVSECALMEYKKLRVFAFVASFLSYLCRRLFMLWIRLDWILCSVLYEIFFSKQEMWVRIGWLIYKVHLTYKSRSLLQLRYPLMSSYLLYLRCLMDLIHFSRNTLPAFWVLGHFSLGFRVCMSYFHF